MRQIIFMLLALSPFSAFGNWEVKSEFQLHLTETLFDKVIGDFQQSLQGQQSLAIGDVTITPAGFPVHINGIRVDVSYAFAPPRRLDSTHREWELRSTSVGARLHADLVTATQVIQQVIGGTVIDIEVNAECRNVDLELPPGATAVQAVIAATVAQSQIQLSMPSFSADWHQGAWKVVGMTCTGSTAGFGDILKQQALAYFSSFQNLDSVVRNALSSRFAAWSRQASLLLLSQQDLPTGNDYLKIRYRPTAAAEDSSGVMLQGELDFDYPYVAPDQSIVQEFRLEAGSQLAPGAAPQLLVPSGTVRALIMGEYFSGKLEYGMRSTEVPAFQNLMGSFFQRLIGFPDLLKYSAADTFLFQVVPAGPPSFTRERNAGAGTIGGEVVMPISVRMFAPVGGQYWPYVEFHSTLLGPATMRLGNNGAVDFRINAQPQPVTYDWSQAYLRYFRPNTHIAVDAIGGAVRDSLSSQGLSLRFPSLHVGESLRLLPNQWKLDGQNLVVDFDAAK